MTTTTQQAVALAREAGDEIQQKWGVSGLTGSTLYMEFAEEVALRVAALVADHEREKRIAAQSENEALKEKLAASGVVERRAVNNAVMAEREECAKVCELLFNSSDDSCDEAERCAAAIRARVQA